MRPDFGPHFLIATDSEAATGAESVTLDGVNGFSVWENEAHGMGEDNLAELQFIITGCAHDYSVLDEYQVAFTACEMHGPWLLKLPHAFLKALADLDSQPIHQIGATWLAISDSLTFRKAPQEWLQQNVERLVQLAARAAQCGKNLYWEVPSC